MASPFEEEDEDADDQEQHQSSPLYVLNKLCCARGNGCLRVLLERMAPGESTPQYQNINPLTPTDIEMIPEEQPKIKRKRRAARWRTEGESQFAEYSSKLPDKYEHTLQSGDIGREQSRLHLNLKVDVFVYDKVDDGIFITRRQVEENRHILRTLRKVAGTDWAFLDEHDVDDILARQSSEAAAAKSKGSSHRKLGLPKGSSSAGKKTSSSSSSSRPFRWNF